MPLEELKRRPSSKPMLLSLVTHTIIVLVLLLAIRPIGNRAKGEPDREISVVLTDSTSKDAKYLTEKDLQKETDLEQSESKSDSTSPSAATEPAPDLGLSNQGNPSEITSPLETSLTDANSLTTKTTASPDNSQYELTDSDLKMIAADRQLLRSREPVGEPASISVFGTGKLTGRSFVFVLDRSQSMGQGGLGVIVQAQKELTEAIEKLELNHQFQIVAYHDRPVSIEGRSLLTANEKNKALAPGFIAKLAAYGGTDHKKGLIAALAFRPDVIVFMTDGGYPILNASELNLMQTMAGNRADFKGTEIHCLQFGSGPNQTTRNFMIDLATLNHGTFRYINVSNWD